MARAAGLLLAVTSAGAVGSALSAGCNGWSPSKPFERNSPEVDEALEFIDSGAFESAEQVLEKYLGTGACEKGNIGLPDTVRDRYNGSFDLGLVLFHLAEKFGRPFGEEETGEAPSDDPQAERRSLEIDCALILVKAIAADPKVPVELRARARYLAGNLEFLRRKYEEAVEEYDQALGLVPGVTGDAGDGIGRDVAWNRAIALRRIQDQKDAGSDADADSDAPDSDDAGEDSPDAPDADDGDAGEDGPSDAADAGDDGDAGDGGDPSDAAGDGGQDAGGDGGQDAGGDGGQDAGGDAGGDEDRDQEPQPAEPQPADPHAQQASPDDRILDRLEEAPSYQEEEAKKRAAGRRRGRMEDK